MCLRQKGCPFCSLLAVLIKPVVAMATLTPVSDALCGDNNNLVEKVGRLKNGQALKAVSKAEVTVCQLLKQGEMCVWKRLFSQSFSSVNMWLYFKCT